jgi:hypothetical protein
MATAFSLKDQAGNSYDFDLLGSVLQGGNAIGTWTTDANNNLAMTLNAAGAPAPAPFPVEWDFTQNELRLYSGGKLLFNFNGTKGVVPDYTSINAIIYVEPTGDPGFRFPLYATWGLTDNHDLRVTIGASTSTIAGILEDDQSRFLFTFISQNPSDDEELYTLGFAGSWQSTNVNGVPMMSFVYKIQDAAGNIQDSPTPFSLPLGIQLDKNINQFVYNYSKDGQTHSIQLVGLLEISPDFQITYSIKAQTSGSGLPLTSGTTIQIQTKFNMQEFKGGLQLTVLANDGTPGVTLTVGGNFQYVFGQNTLGMGFSYSQNSSTKTRTVGFNGNLTLVNGTTLQWTFLASPNVGTFSLSVTAGFMLGNVAGAIAVTVVDQNGQLQSISVVAGFRFP